MIYININIYIYIELLDTITNFIVDRTSYERLLNPNSPTASNHESVFFLMSECFELMKWALPCVFVGARALLHKRSRVPACVARVHSVSCVCVCGVGV